MDNVHKPTSSEIRDLHSFVHNFQVSVVLPFYKKFSAFKEAMFINAPYFSRNGIEVIISMDENSEENEVVEFIKSYPFINWKVIVNDALHSWRNPVKSINVGIRNASKKYILVCSPESLFYTDAIYLMRKYLEFYPGHFAVGTVAFATCNDIKNNNLNFCMPYGSIFAEKQAFERVSGYDESLVMWGGDDDNIRARLEMCGVKKLFLPEVKLIHKEKSNSDIQSRYAKKISRLESKHIFYPGNPIANFFEQWGQDYKRIAYDWRHNEYSIQLLKKYLNDFIQYDLNEDASRVKKNIILLVQVYNGAKLLKKFIRNVEQYVDGIIFLDDGSDDDTYDFIVSSKLLLKVKKIRKCFNDLENRNIMLRLASFFDSEWFCIMDVDELFDERFVDFKNVVSDPSIDTVIFRHTHLWNSEITYNAEYPNSQNGILERYRMFRNIGSCQILTDKLKLHFSPVPYYGKTLKSGIMYHHLGNISKQKRIARYLMYKHEDIYNDQEGYEHLLNHFPKLLLVKDIVYNDNIFINIDN